MKTFLIMAVYRLTMVVKKKKSVKKAKKIKKKPTKRKPTTKKAKKSVVITPKKIKSVMAVAQDQAAKVSAAVDKLSLNQVYALSYLIMKDVLQLMNDLNEEYNMLSSRQRDIYALSDLTKEEMKILDHLDKVIDLEKEKVDKVILKFTSDNVYKSLERHGKDIKAQTLDATSKMLSIIAKEDKIMEKLKQLFKSKYEAISSKNLTKYVFVYNQIVKLFRKLNLEIEVYLKDLDKLKDAIYF